jgi:outer membrane autotransporter protein
LWSDLDGDGNSAGFDADTAGLTVGADQAFRPGLRGGLAFGLARTDAEFPERAGAEAELDSYTASLYGQHRRGAWRIDGILSYMFETVETARPIPGIGTAEAVFDVHGVGVSAEAGYGFALAALPGLRVEPVAGLRYAGLWRDGFAETGAGPVGLIVEDDQSDSLRTRLGVEAAWAVTVGGAALTPSARAFWEHELLDDDAAIRARFAGAPLLAGFTAAGVEVDRDSAVLGLGLAASAGEKLSLFVDYDARLNADLTEHAVSGGLRVRW